MPRRLAIMALLMGVGLSSATLSSGPVSAGTTTSGAACMVPPHVALTPENTAAGVPSFAQWRASASAQVAIAKLNEAIDQEFGSISNSDPLSQLRRGYIGTAISDSTREFIVVVDPGLADRATLESRLNDVTGADLTVKVIGGCNSAGDLLRAASAAFTSGTAGSAVGGPLIGEVSPYDSRLHLALANAAKMWGDTVAAKYGNAVAMSYTDAAAGSRASGTQRANDSQPHWAGSKIDDGVSACTAGFTVDTVGAGKAMITAGHCFAVNAIISSGTQSFGTVRRRASYPTYDFELINDANQNYDDKIHFNPINSPGTPIDVDGSARPGVGALVRSSGYTTKAECNLEVAGTNGHMCDAPGSGCTGNLLRYDVIETSCTHGDSGGPVFTRSGGHAQVAGIIIAWASTSADHYATGCLAQKASTIETEFNVTVATSP